MWLWVPGGLALAAASGWILQRALAPFAEIWSGDTSRVLALPTQSGRVKARSYLAYLLWLVPGAAGLFLLGFLFAASAIFDEPSGFALVLARLGFTLLVSAFPLALAHVVVDAFNKPDFLVPPPYRGQRGSIAERRHRTQRTADGLPPTDHLVEIIDVSGLRESGDGYESYIFARCAQESCDWDGQVTRKKHDPPLSATDVEDQVRALAHKHSTNVAAATVRPLDEVS